jgi:hypothetical protein
MWSSSRLREASVMSHRAQIVLHPNYVESRDGLILILNSEKEGTHDPGRVRGRLVFVVGLSGVGKSEIRYDARKSNAGPAANWGVGQLPVIAVRAAPTEGGNYNPKYFNTRMYSELAEPNLEWLLAREEVSGPDQVHRFAEMRLESPLWRGIKEHKTEGQIRELIEDMAVIRGLRKVFIEEGAAITYTPANKLPGDHMESLMCLAEELDITLIIFGVPRMAALWEGNGEVLRRSRFVWVRRYGLAHQSDRENFERLVKTIACRYRFTSNRVVASSLDLAYACSAGVYGELDAYFQRADDIRAINHEPVITASHLKEAVGTESTLETLHREAELFDRLRERASDRFIRKLLGRG